MFIKVGFSFISKLFAYKNGALAVVSGGISSGVVFYLRELAKGTETKNLVLPILVFIFGFFVYFTFLLIDLLTGLWNAKYQNSILAKPRDSYIKSYKLYRTMWKGLGITMFAFMVMLVTIFTELIDGDYSYYFALWALVTVWLMASAFEFHSIGENIQKRTGEMPEFFKFIEKITSAAQVGIIFRAKKTFAVLETEKPEEIPQQLQEADAKIQEITQNTLKNETETSKE